MERRINTYNCIEGFHNYPNAPKWCSYLANRHRHLFVITCSFRVLHNNREIEINEQQHLIDNYLKKVFGNPCEFNEYSCEDIAENLINAFDNMVECKVLEDGYGGATLTR